MGMGSRVAAVVVVCAALGAVAWAAQPSPAAAAAPAAGGSKKILALLPMPARSHHIFFTVLLKALLDKGHSVTLICSLPPTLTHPNQKVIQVGDVFAAMRRSTDTESVDSFTALAAGYVGQQFLLWGIGEALTNVTLSHPEVLALRDVKHDLVITEAFFFQEALLGFADHYKAPSLVLNPFGFNLWLNDLTGGAINPSYVPNALLWMTDHMTFYERFLNTLYALFELVGYYGWYYAKQDAMLHQVFPRAPPLKELVRNISLTMVNNQAALSYPVPLAPTVLEVGGLHITPGRALPADLKKWLDDSPNGFVYFSMGSNLQASDMPKDKIDVFLTTFRSLKQKVLIKWDSKVPDNMPANFRFEAWLPQQEILSHPKAVLFITHGGLLSTQESVYHGVPVVGIPIFGDQFMNMEVATRKGFGTMVSYKQISVSALAAALDEVLHNPSYREKAQKLSNLFRSQPQPPLEKALTYIDLLFKWGNTDHLRPASLDLTWYQLILLDVFAVIFLGLYIVYRVIRGIFVLFAKCLCGSSSKPPPKKGAQRPKKD